MADKDAELQLQDIIAQLRTTIGSVFGPESLELLGEEAANIIRRRTRLGFGVASTGSERFRLRPLTDRYMKFRTVKRSRLSDMTKPRRSNLTLRGDMLDDLGVKSVNPMRGQVVLGFRNQSSLDKATWNTDSGRPFNNLSRLEIKQLGRFKEKELEAELRKARL